MIISSNAGHSAHSPGVSGNGYKEHVVARKINEIFIREARKMGYTVVDSTSNEKTQAKVINEQVNRSNISNAHIAISHHLNSNKGEAGTGVEVLYYRGSKAGYNLAKPISEAIAKTYGFRNRGAKERANLGFLRRTRMPAVLIEWGFINNKDDIETILADIDKGVLAVLQVLKNLYEPPQAPTKPTTTPTPTRAPKAPSGRSRLLKRGVRGADVKALQEVLILLGYTDQFGKRLKADGIFGRRTEAALKKFQRSRRIAADGIAGRITYGKLGWKWN